MIRVIFSLIFLFIFGCTPTNQALTDLTGGETITTTKATTVNGPLGNSALVFSPSSKDFGTMAANSGISSQTFTVTNTSAYTIFLGTLTGATSHFTLTASSCTNGLQMAPNITCSIVVQFAPLTTGTLSTLFSLSYDVTNGTNSFSSGVGVSGAGTTLTGFGGLTTISAINVTDVTLNWSDAGVSAGSYQAYQITVSGAAILIGNLVRASVCGGGVCASQITGLNPSTVYTFRIRATDTNSVQEQNIVNQTATTLAGQLDLASNATTSAGICLPMTVTIKDGGGTPTNITTTSAITISGKGSGSLFSNSICSLALTNPIIASGTSSTIFYFKDTLAETLTLNSSLSTYSTDNQGLIITPASADHFVLIGGNNQTATVNSSLATAAAVQVVDLYGNGVSGISLSVLDWYGLNGQATSSILTTDANGRASTGITIGSIDIKDTFVIERTGTVLPDLALSGNSRMFFTETTTTSGTGIFAGFNITGSAPNGGAAGDFNGDGKMDMVSANYSGSSISIFLGNGNGTFTSKVDYTTAANPYDVIVGYFNADAFLDIATADYGASKLSVFIGVGDGTFAAKVDYTTGTNPSGLTSGDYDGDGDIDIATANRNSSTISIFLGVGDGTFAAKADMVAATWPLTLTSADINGDGAKDIIVANNETANFSVFRNNNNGSGTFAAKVDYASGTNTYHVQTGLLNNDAYVDIVTANYTGNTVSVFLGNAAGTFPTRVDYATGAGPSKIDIFDYNGDTFKDLIVVDYIENAVSIIAGAGDGTFAAKVDFTTGVGSSPYCLFSGNFNADTSRDIVTVNASSSTMTLLMGTGSSFKHPARALATGVSAYDQVMGDLNRDGKIDLISVNYGSNTLSVFMGQGNGRFASKVDYNTNTSPSSATLHDFNGDSYLDVVVSHFGAGINSVGVFLGIGDGTFAARVDYAVGTTPFRNAVGDFNGDGKIDIVATNSGGANLSVLLGNGDGTFALQVTYATGANPYAISVGDFNKDKKLDLAVSNYGESTVSILTGAGDGTFAARVSYPVAGNPTGLSIGDVNNDTYQDLIPSSYGSSVVNILLNNGDGTFAAKTSYASGTSPYNVMTGDFNNDGKLDVLSANNGSGNISVFTGTGTGTVNTKVDYKIPTGNPVDVYAADLDGDGKLEIITSTGTSLWIIPGL